MAGFLNGNGFEGTAPPQQAVEQAPSALGAGAGRLFELMASGKEKSGSSADQRAQMMVAGRETLYERAEEIRQISLQGGNVKPLLSEAIMAGYGSGLGAAEVNKIIESVGLNPGEVNSTVGNGSPNDYSNMEPPAKEFAAIYNATKLQNPKMGEDELHATAKSVWVNRKLYEDDAQWSALSTNQAWQASKDFAYGNANTAFWQLMAGDLNTTPGGGQNPDNQVSGDTLNGMRTLISEAKDDMKSRWNARNKEEGGSDRDEDIEKLFWQFDKAIDIAEEGMLLGGDGKTSPNYKIATWVMTQNGSDIAAMINRYAANAGHKGNKVSAGGEEFTAAVKVQIGNWMKAFTLGASRAEDQTDHFTIEGELKGDDSIVKLLGDDRGVEDIPRTLQYIYNAVIEEGTADYLKSKREEINSLSKTMGWSIESPDGVDPAAATGDGPSSTSGSAGASGSGGASGSAGDGASETVGKTVVENVHPLVLFALDKDNTPAATRAGTSQGGHKAAEVERLAIEEITKFYDGGVILGGVTTAPHGKIPQIKAWQGYESATPDMKKAMEGQVGAAGEHLARVLKTVISMDVNGMDGPLQEKVMGSERMVNIIRAMNSSGVPGARETALALAHMQGVAANNIVTLNGKYFNSIAKTIEDSSWGEIIKPATDTGPVEINLEAFTDDSPLGSFKMGWNYELNEETPGNLRNLLESVRDVDQVDGYGNAISVYKGMTDHELIKVLAAGSLASSNGKLKLISRDGDNYQWNALNNVVGGIGLEGDKGDTLSGLTANQYAAVMTGIEGISTQLQRYEKANAGRESSFNAMEGAKTLWTELTGQGFKEDGDPMVSLKEAAAGVTSTPDAAEGVANTPDGDTAAEQVGKGEAGEDFGAFLQQFARERGYSEEEIAKTVADINAAGGSAAYIKGQKEQNPAYFHEDVAAAIAAKPDDLWIEGEDGKIVQNPDADVNEAREGWELGVLDALRKIDPASTVEDAKEAVAVATAVEAEKEAGTSRTPDELKVALEKGEIDQATFDAEMAKIGEVSKGISNEEVTVTPLDGDTGVQTLVDGANAAIDASEKSQLTPDELKVALEKGEIDQATFDAEMAKITGTGLGKNVPELTNSAAATDQYEMYTPGLTDPAAADTTTAGETAMPPPVKEAVVPRGQVSDPEGNVHHPWNNHEVIVSSLITTEARGGSATAWDSRNNVKGAAGTVGGVLVTEGHFGRLQFGPARLQEAQEAGIMPADMTVEGFLKSPRVQLAVERWHFADHTKNITKAGLQSMIGKRVGGVTVTMNGMLAAAHLGGFNGMKKFIQGGANPKDANGTSLMKYLRVHGGANAPVMQAQHKPEVMEQFLGKGHSQLDVALSNNLTSLLRDAKAAGHKVTLNSGYRSPERQAEILANNMTRRERGGFTNGERDQWMADVQKHGAVGALSVNRNGRSWRQRFQHTPNGNSIRRWIGLPGGSRHQHGLAGDLNFYESDAAEKWIHDNAEKYGLNFPMGHEPWHIELLGGAAAASGYSAASAGDALMIQDYAREEGIDYGTAMDQLTDQGLLSPEEDYVPEALADDFGDPSASFQSDAEAPFMRQPPEDRVAGYDDKLKDPAWRKLEESEIEELIEISEGDSGLKDQAGMSLGHRYQNGRGVPTDKDKARQFYEGVVMEGGELAEEAATALESIDNATPAEALQLMREEGRGTMIKGEPYILLPGGVVVRGRDGEVANDAITAVVKKRLRVDPK